jgi:hypothetical protein
LQASRYGRLGSNEGLATVAAVSDVEGRVPQLSFPGAGSTTAQTSYSVGTKSLLKIEVDRVIEDVESVSGSVAQRREVGVGTRLVMELD